MSLPPLPKVSLGEILIGLAEQRSDETALRFIEPAGESPAEATVTTLSYKQLAKQAAVIAHHLARHCEPGDRVLLQCPPGPEYAAALFGCFFSGTIAVPAYPPLTSGVDQRLTHLIRDSRPRIVLTTSLLAPLCEVGIGDVAGAGLTTLVIDQLEEVDVEVSDVARQASPDDLAFLQYTSGSTGNPRGVVLSHANLVANTDLSIAVTGATTDDHGVFWIPPYHDMGLIGGILGFISAGIETTLMSPLAFLVDPLFWLEAVTKYQGTFTGAPNFAYDLCVRRSTEERMAKLDLSSWQIVVNGAEPARHETMNRFAEHFGQVGFRRSAFMACYGLAEATLMVSGRKWLDDSGDGGNAGQPPPLPQGEKLVPVGRADNSTTLLIVDRKTHRECEEGEVGEIWCQGPSIARGYWNNEEETNETFRAVLPDAPERGEFLRTGDLGTIWNGELYITGRLKDLIIVRGRNYYPHDIEDAATKADPRLRPGCLAAFEVPDGEGQKIVLIAEPAKVLAEPAAELDEVVTDEIWGNVREAVLADQGLSLDELVVIERGEIPKTSSGKIRRRPTRESYLQGTLPVLVTRRAPNVSAGADAKRSRFGAFYSRLGGFLRGLASSPEKSGDPDDGESSPAAADRTELVCDLAAAILGYASARDVDPEKNFKELGFDSLAAVELRNRLGEATGLSLPATLVFDHPTPAQVAAFLREQEEGSGESARPQVHASAGSEEPIAIVGMSCRFPGGASSPEELWRLVSEGGDAIGGLPTDRGWDVERIYDPDPDAPGTTYTRHGGFLPDAGEFDAAFFGIGPREALAMDPQQRLLLEGAWEALEDAGIDPTALRGSRTGVFAGVLNPDYGLMSGAARRDLEGYFGTGISASVASGRIAYSLGLEGPAVSVDTACSSSLVAIHLACQALRQGECSLALAGGVTVLSSPAVLIEFSRQRGLAADGRCKAFGAEADGFGPAEGAGLVLLEPLSKAEEEGHEVLAVIRGSATNQDGASNGLTAPNGPSQERVIAQALANAGLTPAEIDAVEAHGTGTPLGDPIEAQALLATYGQERENGPLRLGSLKSNIGHTQAAAGVAGVIKMVQAMRHGALPRTLHADKPSEHIEWDAGEVELLSREVPWEPNGRPRRAGVSSFGISGTNAHLILEEAPVAQEAEKKEGAPLLTGPLPFLLSAKSEPALREQAERLAAHLRKHPGLDAGEVAAALALGRPHLEHRAVIVSADREQLLAGLDALSQGRPHEGLLTGTATVRGKVAFVFPGQGSQWERMAVELWDSSPAFAERMRACEQALAPYVKWSLEAVLRGEAGAPTLDRVDVVQPALFAVMVSLAGLWRDCGVSPEVLIGHSQGEIAAAHVGGALSLEDAARIIALRANAMTEKLSGKGGMLSIAIGAEEARSRIEPFGGRISLATVNGPAAVVVSGAPEVLEELLARLEAEGIRARILPFDYAAHSPQVEAIRDELLEACAPIKPQAGEVPLLFALTGETVAGGDLDAEYWYRNMRETVQFARATEVALEQGHRAFVEVTPHPVLAMAVQESAEQALPDETVMAIGSLRRDQGGPDRFLASLAEAHVNGVRVEWARLLGRRAGKRVELPTYPFQRERFWLESGLGVGDVAAAGQAPADHPLLSAAVPLADGEGCLFTGRLSTDGHPWIADHAVMGTALLPGTAFLELALAAGERVGAEAVEELILQAPLLFAGQGAVQLQLTVSGPDEEGRRELSIHSRPESAAEEDGEWTLHASGLLGPGEGAAAESLAGESWPPPGAEPAEVEFLYDRLAEAGYEYGPAFQGLTAAWRRGEELFAEVSLAPEQQGSAQDFCLHPALSDAALHSFALAALDGEGANEARVPFSFAGARLDAQGASRLRVRIGKGADGAAELRAFDEQGGAVLTIGSIETRAVDPGALRGSGGRVPDALFELQWQELPPAPPADSPPRAALLGPGEIGGIKADRYPDLGALEAAIEAGETAPDVVLARAPEPVAPGASSEQLALEARQIAERTLSLLQAFLASEPLAEARLVLVTEGTLAVKASEAPDLGQAALPGLMRSAFVEHPERLALVDIDASEASGQVLAQALALGAEEPQLAIREGALRAPRLAKPGSGDWLTPPAGEEPWRLEFISAGTLENLALAPNPAAAAPLEPGQVRVAVHAGGLNFRDVVIALGLVSFPEDVQLGGEGAGVVVEVGPGVSGLAVGDRVMGLLSEGYGTLAVSDSRVVAKVPASLSYAEAASVPIAFLTAFYGLVDLAQLQKGERLLVHAAAGGVGMAAVQIARHLGAEVFATAHPSKWPVLEELGIDSSHVASSRDAEFKEKFLEQTGGEGVDVVLDSLAGDLIDASLDLLPRGGRFIEMGKTDIRDAEEVAAEHPGVAYRAFDLQEAGPERIGEMLAGVMGLLAAGSLAPLPVRVFDVRDGRDAFRFMREARHVGKIVLSVPQPPDPEGTVLVTGGTGGLGSLVARHLAGHGARHLLLVSRSGAEGEGVPELRAELEGLGAEVTIAACDVSDRAELERLLSSLPEERPLSAVVHAAGALDDGLLTSLDGERLARVMAPKVDAALHLHELTRELPLAELILFSSAAATLGSPAQGNYAAANAFLDALAHRRRAEGLPATSLAWGYWEQATGLTGGMSEADRERLARVGIAPIADAQGLELFEAARAQGEPLLVPMPIDTAALRPLAKSGILPPILQGLVRTPARRAAADGGSLARKLAETPEGERDKVALDLVLTHVAAVLGHSSAEAIDPERNFKDLGFDSLAAVELRNRLGAAAGLRLPATVVFDHPTPAAAAKLLRERVEGAKQGAATPRRSPARSEEPIAIVGMSCRYPGGASSPEELWRLVTSGTDAITEFPDDRGWEVERIYDPDPDSPGTTYTRHGGFLPDVGEFDAAFFGIGPREALAMDPQQRLLLEGAWEALEDAGIDPVSLRGSQTGVFAGIIDSGYGGLGAGAVHHELEGYLGTGSTASVASGRIAYSLGLEGPAVSVDTACSSSLVAIHLACQALRQGECSLALAGGVMVISSPAGFIEFSRQRGLAVDGRCKAFGAEADGMGPAEGVGLVLLEPLSEARRNGHEVLAVVRGSATNQDGASNGLTAPNGPSQERVISQALVNAGLTPAEVDAVEAHGTGTPLGDPIEAQALLATYGQERENGPLRLGSIKSNIGHTQAAAGVAGVIKMVQAMRHGALPRTLHVDTPSEHIEWDEGEVELLSEEVPWEPNGRPRRAGVSSFGISGTNAHLILEETPASQEAEKEEGDPLLTGPLPVLLSAKSEPAMREQAQRLAARLRQDPELSPTDFAYSLAATRTAFEHRAVVLGEGRDELLAALDALAAGKPSTDVVAGRAQGQGKLAFLFPGQGSQWQGMAVELWDSSPAFAKAMSECEAALAPHVDWSLEDVLRGKEGAPSLDRVDVVQPALFAVMVSLARLWRCFGVEPAAVVGHSQGEIAAAHVAGALSLEDAARVVALRGKALAEELAGKGGMLSIAIGAEEARSRIEPFGGCISLAAVNGPAAVVVSGEPEALKELLGQLEAEEVRARMIPVDYAAHSRHVEAIKGKLLEGCAPIEPQDGEVPFLSAVAAEVLDAGQLDAEYWYRNLRETVQFERATALALEQGHRAFVEVSPHPVLAMAVQESAERVLPDEAVAAIGSLRRGQGGPDRFLHSLAELWVNGGRIEWARAFAGAAPKRVPLPTYPFQRERYWLESKPGTGDVTAAGLASTAHPLLGAEVALADGEGRLFTGRISTESHPWLADHAVMGNVLLPGTAFLELALAAAERVGAEAVEELTLQAPLLFGEGAAVQLQLTASAPDGEGRRELSIYSRPAETDEREEGEWTLHASAQLGSPQGTPAPESIAGESWPPQGAEPVEVEDLYDRLAEAGYEYGPAFQGMTAAWRRGEEVFAEVSLAEQQSTQGFCLHPALSDAALHGFALAALDAEGDAVQVPFSFSGARLYAGGASRLRVRLGQGAGGAASLSAFDEQGEAVFAIEAIEVREIDPGALRGSSRQGPDALFEMQWIELAPEAADGAARVALLGSDELDGVPGIEADRYPDFEALGAAIEAGEPAPDLVLARASEPAEPAASSEGLADAVQRTTERTLLLLQGFLSCGPLAEARFVLITEGALAAKAGEAPDLTQAALPGLIRSSQVEHLGRFALVDVDSTEASLAALAGALGSEEPQLALREGVLYAPRLARPGTGSSLTPPAGEEPWHLAFDSAGTLENLALAPNPAAAQPLGPGQVRVAVHAAGLNFRDVVVALGLVSVPEGAPLGGEGAGVVVEVAPDVEGLEVGDRVMGMLADAYGTLAISDHRLLAKTPADWSHTQAASIPIAFLTAYYGLVDLAQLKAGERVLIHSAAGGVGMAAVQIARHLGAEIFATAHPSKWPVLEGMGIEADHIASSRDASFKDKFLEQTGGGGVDVVLDSLAGELIDASLDLLPRGGRFIEMGKTDIRDAERVAADHPGVAYRAFDLQEAGLERIEQMLGEVLGLFEGGVFRHPPIAGFDLRRAPDAFRFMREARHVGKIVLSVPQPPDPEGTVLVTGGTSGIGALTARHLAGRGARHLLLVSRSGADAEGAQELREELESLGAEVTIAACDVADKAELAKLISSLPEEQPLSAVVHAAGALDDGVVTSLDGERLARVMAPKVRGAWNLHELTRELPLGEFVVYSSAAAVLGSPGQGNYAAANSFLDALAYSRRAEGLPATSLAWGYWEQATGLTGGMSEADRARLARVGLTPIADEQGLELLDAARAQGEPLLVPMPVDTATLRGLARTGMLHPLLQGLVRAPARRAGADGSSLARRLAEAPEAEWDKIVLELVRSHVATVLGHSSAEAIEPTRNFKDLGFDSLAAVELRNRLNTATGLRLPATLAFDHPTPAAAAKLLRERVEGVKRSAATPRRSPAPTEEPIAIVGMSCRYPGATSPQRLWQLLRDGTDAISEFPTDRGWDVERLYDPDPDAPGASYTRHGGFLPDVGEFDAAFFGIGPREALAMDPQQRLLLESAWEALEDAGIDPASLRGSQTGVFAGVMSSDYGVIGSGVLRSDLEGYLGTGVSGSVVSGRVAYTFGLEGPAVSVDTACSSSLVAIHLACQALRQGECSLALAGGVTVLSSPAAFIEFSRQRGLAVDGRCKAFGAEADGMGPAEGVGVVLLEPLSEARRNGHEVLAVVRGSATNQDGASNGLTAPNGPSQERVISQALANAGVSAAEIDVVEAHGTGTALGDPIEAQALLATYGQERSDGPLHLGSIKSNIGHTQAAAGVAGVIKMVQAMRHGALPRTLHVDPPSEHIEWDEGEVELLAEEIPWEPDGRPRRAGVSSFGISGTNAHLILEEAPAGEEQAATPDVPSPAQPGPLPFLVSAKDGKALKLQAERLASHLREHPELEPNEVAARLALGRSHLEHRAAIVASGREQLLAGLDALSHDRPLDGLLTGRATAAGKVAFLFPGQGSQWEGMALELLDSSPLFAERMRACEEALSPHTGWSLEAVLRGGEGAPSLDRVDVVQPALFAVMVSLAALWRSFGVEPAVVVGHSQGEIAAAHVAGALSLEEAARVVALRSRALADELAGKGGMVSVSLSAERAEAEIEPFGGRISLAAVNGPSSVVVSGEPEALEELLALCEQKGVRAKQIPVDYAAHSHQIETIRERLEAELAGLSPRSGEIPFYSTATGGLLDTAQLDAGYWYRNLRETVQFEGATRALLEDSFTAFVEVSPHPVLAMALEESFEAAGADPDAVAAIGSLRRDHGDMVRFLSSLAEAHAHGVAIGWTRLFDRGAAKRVELPTYPFQRERFWLESKLGAGDVTAAGLASTGHPLLGAALQLAGKGQEESLVFTGLISAESHSWLADHAVMGTALLPGTAFLELALHVGAKVGLRTVEELVLQAPLVLPESGGIQLQVSIGALDGQGRRAVEIYSRPEEPGGDGDLPEADQWVLNAGGTLLGEEEPVESMPSGPWPPEGAEPIEVEDLYDRLAAAGFEYGPTFQGLLAAWQRGEEIYAEVSLPEGGRQGGDSFEIHPALLDAALHGAGAALLAGNGEAPAAGLPFAWNGVSMHGSGVETLRVRLARAEGENGSSPEAISVLLADESGMPIGSVRSLVTRPVSEAGLLGAGAGHYESLFRLEWVGVEADGAASPAPVVDHADLADPAEEERAPELVLFDAASLGGGEELPAAAHATLHRALALIQGWLSEERFASSRLVVLTHGAVSARPGEEVGDLAAAPLWGLVRSAQSEHPGRFALLDIDDDAASASELPAALSALASLGEPQLALRGGELLAPRVARATSGGALTPPAEAAAWRLEAADTGTLEDLALLPCEEAAAPLVEGQVRVAVHAAGMNFRDVLIGLGMYPDRVLLGSEGAGVVTEVGPGVEGLAPGDWVMGLLPGCFGPVAVTHQHLLAKVPDSWSYTQAASVPTVFLTATYALFDLAELKAGEKLLVHSAAGGVGMAAVQLARQAGVEVYATAHPDKWPVLEGMGIDPSRIASSRDDSFKEKFLAETGGEGVDVVLDSLAGELIDASLDLLPRGGRFIEMGKTDVRDAEQVAADHPGVAYRAFDMAEAGPERIGEMLGEVLSRFEAGELEHLPTKSFDLRHAPEAFRFMREARHVGKLVLDVPQPIDREGTALVTGGTGVLGSLVARHLAGEHGIGHLVLASRQGPTAEGAKELEEELQELGAEVTIAACDVSNRDQLAALIDLIPAERPLRAVIHTAGALDDGTIDSLTPERLDTVLAPKADAAWHLHELTAGMDLDAFVVFSSAAATVGAPGQGNYAAANAFLDALAAHRRSQGLPATSLAWGFWAELSGLTGGLREEDLERMQRAGVGALSSEEGLALFDATYAAADPLMLPVRLDIAKLRAGARAGAVPPLLRGLLPSTSRQAVESGSLARRLAGVPEAEREGVVLELLRSHIATVLGHSSAEAIDPERNFKELGFDSLAAVELRNRLNTATGKRLPATLVFDYPTPTVLGGYLVEKVASGGSEAVSAHTDIDKLERTLSSLSPDGSERAAVVARLRKLLLNVEEGQAGDAVSVAEKIESASDEEIFEFLDAELGGSDED